MLEKRNDSVYKREIKLCFQGPCVRKISLCRCVCSCPYAKEKVYVCLEGEMMMYLRSRHAVC